MSRALKSLAIFFAFVAIFTLSRHFATTSTTTTSTSTTVPSSGTTTTTAAAAGTSCTGSDFRGVFNQGQGAAGTIYASITLTKSTPGTCTVKGWPLLTLQDRLGALLTSSTVDVPSASAHFQFIDSRANRAPTLVTLASGASTTFSLAYSDVPTGTETTCPAARTISVSLAKGASTVTVTPQYPPAPCNSGQILVSPFY